MLGSDPPLLKESWGIVSFLPIMDGSAENEVHGEIVSQTFLSVLMYIFPYLPDM